MKLFNNFNPSLVFIPHKVFLLSKIPNILNLNLILLIVFAAISPFPNKYIFFVIKSGLLVLKNIELFIRT
jgi:hypothetical protein